MPGLFDRIKDTWVAGSPTLLTTLSSFVVSGTAPGGYQTFSARYVLAEGNIPVAIVSQTSNDWMTCWCTYTAANTLRVDTIMFSSNGDAGVTFPAGTMDIFVTPAARAIPGLREVNTFTANNYFTTGNVGIGTSAPASPLHVVSAANFQPQVIADHVAGAGTGAAYFVLDRARGTPSARTAVVSGDTLGTLMARGHDGSTQQNSAWISFDVDGTVSAGNVPTGITFFTTPVGGSTTSRMHIDADGNVGIGTTGPGKRLDVVGQLRASNTAASGYALLEYGSSATATNNWHVGSEGDGTFRWYNGTFGAGTELMRITSAGNVGIGTLVPASPLHVERNQAAETAFFINNTNASGYSALRIGPSDRSTNFDMLLYSSTSASGIRAGSRPLLFESGNGTERMRMDVNGNFGIGTGSPSSYDAKLAVFNGNIALTTTQNKLYLYYFTGTNHAHISTDTGGQITISNGTGGVNEKLRIDTLGRVGIGTAAPDTKRDGSSATDNLIVSRSSGGYAGFNRVAPAGQAAYDFYTINGVEQARVTSLATGLYAIATGSSANERLRIDGSGNVGINVPFTGTSVRLAISTNGSQLAGAARSSTLTTYSGDLATTANTEIPLASFGFNSGNQSMLGVRAWRVSTGTDWTTTSICLGMDVDSTPRAGASIWLSSNGNVGVSQVNPLARFHINAADNTPAFLSSGLTRGIRMVHGPNGSVIEGVDQTGTGSLQPLVVGGSEILFTTSSTERMRVHASGGVSIGLGGDPGAAILRLGRNNTASEGGQIEFCRANDNAVGWYIDSFGSAAGSSPNELRFIDLAGGGINRLLLTPRGILTIGVDAGPIDTDTFAVGFRGAPNVDLTADRTLTLTDAGRTIRKTDTTARTVTIPADGAAGSSTNFPIGTCIMLCNGSAASGNLSVVGAASGPTINGFFGARITKTTVAYVIVPGGSASIRKAAANLWVITGAGTS